MTKNQYLAKQVEQYEIFVDCIINNDFDFLIHNCPQVEEKMKIHSILWGEIYAALESGFEIEAVLGDASFDIICTTPDNQGIVLTSVVRGDCLRIIDFGLR